MLVWSLDETRIAEKEGCFIGRRRECEGNLTYEVERINFMVTTGNRPRVIEQQE